MFKSFGILISLLLSFPFSAFSMEAETVRLNTYRRGETIAGEEFIAATEEIADYLTTLEHPTDISGVYKYNCSIKARLIRPSFYQINASVPNRVEGWTEIRMVYSVKDCTRLSDEK